MAGQCEPKALIMAVQKHRILWDASNDAYFNRELKDEAWECVCLDTCDAYRTFDMDEKLKYASELKKKWSNLRDCYRRDLQKVKRMRSKPAMKWTKRYTYSDILSFLAPVLKNRCKDDNDSNEDDNEAVGNTEYRKKQDQAMMRRRLARKHTKDKDGPTRTPKMIENRHEEKEDDDYEDDTKFLLSLRSHMKGVSCNQKLQLKIEMMQLVQKFRKIENPPQSSSVYEWSSYPYANTSNQNVAFYSPSTTQINGRDMPSATPIVSTTASPSAQRICHFLQTPALIIQSPMASAANNPNSSLVAAENRGVSENIAQMQAESELNLEIVKNEF